MPDDPDSIARRLAARQKAVAAAEQAATLFVALMTMQQAEQEVPQ